jgi:hypothetical protein
MTTQEQSARVLFNSVMECIGYLDLALIGLQLGKPNPILLKKIEDSKKVMNQVSMEDFQQYVVENPDFSKVIDNMLITLHQRTTKLIEKLGDL